MPPVLLQPVCRGGVDWPGGLKPRGIKPGATSVKVARPVNRRSPADGTRLRAGYLAARTDVADICLPAI